MGLPLGAAGFLCLASGPEARLLASGLGGGLLRSEERFGLWRNLDSVGLTHPGRADLRFIRR